MLATNFTPELPPELWRYVFRIVTAEGLVYAGEYSLFDLARPARTQEREWLKMKLSLASVCRQWHALAVEFLYQKVWLRHGARGLVESLQNPSRKLESEGYGRYIRHLEIVHYEPLSHYQLVDILALCTQLHTVIKRPFRGPQDVKFWSNLLPPCRFHDNGVTLPSIQRLDWSSDAYTDDEVLHASGITLANLILRTPNLRHLSIASWPGPVFGAIDRITHPILFPSLTTLRLGGYTGLFEAGIRRQDVPNLTRLILHPLNISYRPDGTADSAILNMIGPQLHVVELEGTARALVVSVTHFFGRCPILREFACHVGAPQLSMSPINHPSLKKVHLEIDKLHYFRENLPPAYYSSDEGDIRFWKVLRTEFRNLSGSLFPGLERVVLHGNWDTVVSDGRFRALRQNLLSQGRELEYSNGDPVL